MLIEDNPGDAYLIEDHFEEFANFSYELKKQHFDVILSDLTLPDSDGINTFFRVHNQDSRIPVILLTELDDEAIGSYAVEKGAHDFFVKGQTDGRLLECVIQCSI